MTRRVVVTGMGIVSCIGSDLETVTQSLKNMTSGITKSEEYAELGFRSQVHGVPKIDLNEEGLIDRKLRRFMGDGVAYGYVALDRAIKDSGLTEDQISNERTGIIVGSGGPSSSNQVEAAKTALERGPKRVGPYMVPRCMSSTASATMATPFKIKGVNYTITSACSTSAHCIGNGTELIQFGKQDIVLAGGCEELHWTLSVLFDGMGAMSSKYNDTPETAPRAYDANRDGFVIAGGAGMVVLEELEHAKARGAKIYGEVVGYGATSDGFDMVAPSGEGGMRSMKMALSTVPGGAEAVDYINTHGTSTPVGDIRELDAIREIFGDNVPKISATKSLTGHSLGATGAQEAIYSLLMINNDFIVGSANIETLDDGAKDFPIVQKTEEGVEVNTVLSNSFGFGGTNATLALAKYNG